MTVTHQELDDFRRYADEKLANGGAESLAELVAEWEAQRELDQAAAAIRQSLADYDAGNVKPAGEAFADVRRRLISGQ